MSATMMLTRYGTRAFDLPLSAIIRTAETDLRRHACKRMEADVQRPLRERTEAAARLETLGGVYAFAPKHVRRARTASELLLIAAQDADAAAKSKSPNRVMLYGSPERLVDAAEAAMGDGR